MKILIPLFLLSFLHVPNLLADGVVAETHGGKTIILEWGGYGTQFQQDLKGAHLKITDKSGAILLDEAIKKTDITKYTATENDDSKVEIELEVKSQSTIIHLKFHGFRVDVDSSEELQQDASVNEVAFSEDGNEIQILLKTLRTPNRKPSTGNTLKIDCKIGSFEFSDVVLGIYGDI